MPGQIRLTPHFFIAIILRGKFLVMSIKLALLKSGEDIIADIQEVIYKDNGQSSYIFTNPFAVKLITSQPLEESDELKKVSVSFFPWIPLSKDKMVEVQKDWVVTIVEPTDMVKNSYTERMKENGNESNGSDRSNGSGGTSSPDNNVD